MNFVPLRDEYTDCLEVIRNGIERRLPNTGLSMFVRNDYELPNAFLYCISEFNNVARVSDDDYGIHLMVIYQKYNPRTGAEGDPGDIFAFAGLYKSSGEALSEFEPVKVNETDSNFDREFTVLTTKIKSFLKSQEDSIVRTLRNDYLTV